MGPLLDLAQQAGVPAEVLLVAIVAALVLGSGYRRVWVWGRELRAAEERADRAERRATELQTEADFYRDRAWQFADHASAVLPIAERIARARAPATTAQEGT